MKRNSGKQHPITAYDEVWEGAEQEKKFQCCGKETSVVSDKERYCPSCKATWSKKDSGWSKESQIKEESSNSFVANKLEKIASEYIENQVGLDIAAVHVNLGDLEIYVSRYGKHKIGPENADKNKALAEEWNNMAEELIEILGNEGYPNYEIGRYSVNGFVLNYTDKQKIIEEFDRWTCMECHYESSTRFTKCKRCGSQEVENLG